MIRTRGLTKRFGSFAAVDGVDLDVREGDIYGFLGPNGSGKTTVVRMLLGLVHATAGEIEVLGAPVPARVREVLPAVGALVEGPAAYGHLSGRRNLALLDAAGPGSRRASRAGRVDDALARVGLGGIDNRPVRAYSLGMRQRLGLAAALLVPRQLLVLDEPTNGLDPGGIGEVRSLLAELHAAGTTVFMSSHLLAEIEATCDRVGVLDRGRLLVEDSLAALRAPTGRVIVETPDPDVAVAALDGRVEEWIGDRLAVRADDPAELTAHLVGRGVRVIGVAVERRTLEDVVLSMVGAGSDRVDR
ncbi:ATP-binding cassette domain-containing protein [Sporichthya polymorpha]|uniref:ATP-binding cassette domain-containing protein n=1 Tax=Sporichthya polymorpha TaxID=35751 RepID=UPI000490A291